MTVSLEDLALSERERAFHAPRAGDVALLGVLIAVLLGNGAWIWRQLGAQSPVGRAIFFGLLLLCIYWCVLVYTLKLSLAVGVSPRSISVVRGPWRAEIRWSELTRLMERVQPLDGRRYRWVIAQARDGRRISVREDAIGDYASFRREAYERYRVWRDHGGTWGATGSGPFVARETILDEARWWGISGALIALSGVYFVLLLPASNPLGYALLALAIVCLALLARAFLLRQRYTIDRQVVEARSALRQTRLTWGQVTKVERTRHPISGVILAGVALGRLAVRLASRGDTGIRSFAWSPRVPEYLTLRGGGRHVRIRLHRLMQPDELLAWVEFYDQAQRAGSAARSRPRGAAATSAPLATAGPTSRPLSAEPLTPDMSGASGPLDPWGAGRQGEPVAAQPPRAASPSRPFSPRTPSSPHLRDFERHDGAMPDEGDDATLGRQRSIPDNADLPTTDTPAASPDDAWLRETAALSRIMRVDTGEAGPAAQTPASPRWDANWPAPSSRAAEDTQWDETAGDEAAYPDEEELTYSEAEAIQPWRSEDWQPPILPRFGPSDGGRGPQRDESERER